MYHVDLVFGQLNFILDVPMARPLRIEFVGALYHVTARGNSREDIYRNDANRQQFLMLLKIRSIATIGIAALIV
jgi:hypothetical protein